MKRERECLVSMSSEWGTCKVNGECFVGESEQVTRTLGTRDTSTLFTSERGREREDVLCKNVHGKHCQVVDREKVKQWRSHEWRHAIHEEDAKRRGGEIECFHWLIHSFFPFAFFSVKRVKVKYCKLPGAIDQIKYFNQQWWQWSSMAIKGWITVTHALNTCTLSLLVSSSAKFSLSIHLKMAIAMRADKCVYERRESDEGRAASTTVITYKREREREEEEEEKSCNSVFDHVFMMMTTEPIVVAASVTQAGTERSNVQRERGRRKK